MYAVQNIDGVLKITIVSVDILCKFYISSSVRCETVLCNDDLAKLNRVYLDENWKIIGHKRVSL